MHLRVISDSRSSINYNVVSWDATDLHYLCFMLSSSIGLLSSALIAHFFKSTEMDIETHFILMLICINGVLISFVAVLLWHFRWKGPLFRELVIS